MSASAGEGQLLRLCEVNHKDRPSFQSIHGLIEKCFTDKTPPVSLRNDTNKASPRVMAARGSKTSLPPLPGEFTS